MMSDYVIKQPVSHPGVIETATGDYVDPLDLRPEDVDGYAIARGLSHICRFGGQCVRYYSVAEHCCRMADVVPSHLRRVALLHDAAEAYLCDMPTPVKTRLADYREIEARAGAAILARYRVEDRRDELHAWDAMLLRAEADALMPSKGYGWQWAGGVMPQLIEICPNGGELGWDPERARREWMSRFHKLITG